MNEQQLKRGKEIEEEIKEVDQVLIRVKDRNRPAIYFDNSGSQYNNVTSSMYGHLIDEKTLNIMNRIVGDFVIGQLELKKMELQNELEAL